METKNVPHFLLIDDDPINNNICTRYIQLVFHDADVQAFTNPQAGFEYIRNAYKDSGLENIVLFLDLNMSVVTGWEFLDRFSDLDEILRSKFKIYIFSSSINPKDMEKASQNPHIIGFIQKPITIGNLKSIFI